MTKERKLYKKSIELKFDDSSHRYLVNGITRPVSVTAVTGLLDKPALKFWACNMMESELFTVLQDGGRITMEVIAEAKRAHTKKKEKEATSGSAVHDWCDQFIFNQIKKKPAPPQPKDKAVQNGVLAFLKWNDENKVKYIDSEMLIYSKKNRYAGLMDCKARIGKTLHCIDFKTSKAVYNEMLYQVAAYQDADAEESGTNYGDTYILRLDKKTGDFESHIIPASDHKKNFKAFLGLLAVKRREVELKI